MTPEKRVQTEIIVALGALSDVRVWRNNVGSTEHVGSDGRSQRVTYGVGGRGAPDLLCEVRLPTGHWAALWLEVKAPNGRLRPEQREWHEAAHLAGRHVYTVRSAEDALGAIDAVREQR